MEKQIGVSNTSYPVEYPTKCPICHHYGDIAFVHSFQTREGVQIIFQCPFEDCRSYFIGYYGLPTEKDLISLSPIKPDKRIFRVPLKAGLKKEGFLVHPVWKIIENFKIETDF